MGKRQQDCVDYECRGYHRRPRGKCRPEACSTRADGTCHFVHSMSYSGRRELTLNASTILNLGISPNLGRIDPEHPTFPTTMSVDYVRAYQDPDDITIGCEPGGFPTQAYIKKCVVPVDLPRGQVRVCVSFREPAPTKRNRKTK